MGNVKQEVYVTRAKELKTLTAKQNSASSQLCIELPLLLCPVAGNVNSCSPCNPLITATRSRNAAKASCS